MRDLGFRTLDLRGGGRAEDQTTWRGLCSRAAGLEGEADAAARAIIADVRARGDAAVCELTSRFEQRTLTPEQFEISREARAEAAARVSPDLRAALVTAAHGIRVFHETQVHGHTGLEIEDVSLYSRVAPLRRVAVYAPGGTAAYPSSVLMAGIPAKVAGVPEVILVTPRAPDVVLLAAEIAEVDRVFQIGGAQAIAALALGTATVPRVDKIVGPGNAYVTAAKRQVFGLCAIDGIAGPSEIVVVADAAADPELVAADLIAQAEHDVLACAILITDSEPLVPAVIAALTRQLGDLPRAEIASQALREHGAAVLVDDVAAMVAAVNDYAPEHVELLLADAEAVAPQIVTAGAIFVGAFTPEAAGDYTAGPSHVLPTAGAARFASPLGVWDFVKHTSVLRLGRVALAAQAPAIARLARAEGLEGHARAAELRLRETTWFLRHDAEDMFMTTSDWTRHLRPALAGLDVYDIEPVPVKARLAANELAEPWPMEVVQEIGKRVAQLELNRYPDTSGRKLRALLAQRHGVEPEAVVIGSGSDEIIGFLLTALGGRPSEPSFIVVPTPTFQMYGHAARCRGIGVLEVPLTEELELDEPLMHEALDVATGAALCFLARPNNPTSSLWDAAVIERLIAQHPTTVFVLDEAYISYAPGATLWRQGLPDNVVYMSTLSKIGLAALRVGYCVAPPALRRPLNVVRNPYNVSATSQAIAELVLTKFESVQKAMLTRSLAARQKLVGMLGKIPKARVFPAHANFAVVRLDPPGEATRVAEALAQRGILVKDASALPRLAGCLRVGVGTNAELDLLGKALAEVIPGYGAATS